MLTRDQEAEIGVRISSGRKAQDELDSGAVETPERMSDVREGLSAQDELFMHNVRLVPFTIRRMTFLDSATFDFDDAVTYGLDGLRRAVERFKVEKGFKFSTYATFWVKQAVIRGRQANQSTITIPGHIQDGMRGELLASGEDFDSLGEEYRRVRSLMTLLSIDRKIDRDDDNSGGNTIEYFLLDDETADEDDALWRVSRGQITQVIENALQSVPERNAELWRFHHGFGRPEIRAPKLAESFGISKTAAGEAVKKTNRVLRDALTQAGFSIDFFCAA